MERTGNEKPFTDATQRLFHRALVLGTLQVIGSAKIAVRALLFSHQLLPETVRSIFKKRYFVWNTGCSIKIPDEPIRAFSLSIIRPCKVTMLLFALGIPKMSMLRFSGRPRRIRGYLSSFICTGAIFEMPSFHAFSAASLVLTAQSASALLL